MNKLKWAIRLGIAGVIARTLVTTFYIPEMMRTNPTMTRGDAVNVATILAFILTIALTILLCWLLGRIPPLKPKADPLSTMVASKLAVLAAEEIIERARCSLNASPIAGGDGPAS